MKSVFIDKRDVFTWGCNRIQFISKVESFSCYFFLRGSAPESESLNSDPEPESLNSAPESESLNSDMESESLNTAPEPESLNSDPQL